MGKSNNRVELCSNTGQRGDFLPVRPCPAGLSWRRMVHGFQLVSGEIPWVSILEGSFDSPVCGGRALQLLHVPIGSRATDIL